MSKGFIVSISIIIAALILDIVSLREVSKDVSFSKLEDYVDTELSYYTDLLSSEEYIELFLRDSLSISDLSKIKELEDKLSQDHIFAKVYLRNKEIYWKQGLSDNSFCSIRKATDAVKINICLEVYNDDGELHNFIYSKSGVQHKIYKARDIDKNYNLLNTIPLKIGQRYRSVQLNYFILTAYLLGLILFILNCVRKKNLVLFGAIVIIRIILFFVPWYNRFSNLDLTNQIFSIHNYNSIDLVIDTFLISGCLIFLSKLQFVHRPSQKIFLYNGLILSFLVLLFISHLRLMQMLMYSDYLSISIDNLSDIGIRDTIIYGVTLAILSAIFIYATSAIIYIKSLVSKKYLYTSFLVMTIMGIAAVHFFQLDINPLIFGIFLLSFFFLLDLFIDINYKTITWVIWWSILFGIYLSALFFNYDINKNVDLRVDYLESTFHQPDYDAIKEIVESSILGEINNEVNALLILPEEAQYDRNDFNDYLSKKLKRNDFIIEVFDTNQVNIFDGKYRLPNHLVEITDTILFDEIHNIVWFSDSSNENYIIKTGIQFDQVNIGSEFPINYYRNNKAVKKEIDLSEDEWYLIKNSRKNIIYKNSNVYIKHQADTGKLLVTKKSFFSLIKPIALFSFLFSAIVLLILILGIANILIDFLPENWPFKIQNLDSLNSKIQLSLIMVILFSFFIIAIITTSFLKSFITTKNEAYLKEKINAIARDLENKTQIATSEQQTVAIARNYESDLEITHDADLDIFTIIESESNGDYFPSVFFTKQESPKPYSDYSISNLNRNYLPIFYKDKAVGFTILNYKPGASSRISVFDFLGSIFNVYVFLFLIASVIAIFIARSITKPLSILNQKLSQLSLGKRNELITWDKEDEIGTLIKNYNNMVSQLEKSAQLMAKTERDSAWREMAKQVAHEIKNPLTPMKMYIQHLEKAISQQPENAKAIAKKISATLMEQIDNLTQIANSFSNFAELPQTSNTKIELNSVVQVVHNLFRKREDMNITLSEPIHSVMVFADKNQLIRILNNLVKNAIEAIPQNKKGMIQLKLYTKGDKALIEVSDNGVGVPDNMKDKIFQPKFTTKDSGSGLGLAIASNMLESMNGRLYFDSIEGHGTNFYIELDNIRPKTITLD